MTALDAIEDNSRVRLLVTRVDFGEGTLNGVALARMLRVKWPGAKTVYISRPENSTIPLMLVSSCSCPSHVREEGGNTLGCLVRPHTERLSHRSRRANLCQRHRARVACAGSRCFSIR